jgi:hypothetical protein
MSYSYTTPYATTYSQYSCQYINGQTVYGSPQYESYKPPHQPHYDYESKKEVNKEVKIEEVKEEVKKCEECGGKRYVEYQVDGTFRCDDCREEKLSVIEGNFVDLEKFEFVDTTREDVVCKPHKIWNSLLKVTENFTKHFIYSQHDIDWLNYSGMIGNNLPQAKVVNKTVDYQSYSQRISLFNSDNYILAYFPNNVTMPECLTFIRLDWHFLPINIIDLRKSISNDDYYALRSFLGIKTHNNIRYIHMECSCHVKNTNHYKRKPCKTCDDTHYLVRPFMKKYPCTLCP